MYIKSVEITNFRNIDKMVLEFNKNVNIFIGKNAQGKTSILESIYVLAFSKGSNGFSDDEMVKKDKLFFKIKGSVKIINSLKKLEVLYRTGEKRLKLNNCEVKRVSDYVSNMNVIMFSPDDLDIVKKAPLCRRNFINIELCQLSNDYLRILNEYNKILRMRNEYIRKNYSKIDYNYLDIITHSLVDRAILVYKYRDQYFDDINKIVDNVFLKISKMKGLKIVYKKNVPVFDNKDDLFSFYKNSYDSDIDKGSTLYGPHRDDFLFIFEGNDLKLYGSQGMQRIAILSFKLSEIDLFKERCGTYPIVLLDDIFSEIDIDKRKNLLRFIKSNMQFIITTTDINNISEKLINKASVFTVDNGLIKKRRDRYE